MIENYERNIRNSIEKYHFLLLDFYIELYQKYRSNPRDASAIFLKSISIPRSLYLSFAKDRDLNFGTAGGVYLEWPFFYLIKACLISENKDKILEVINGYQIPFRWKQRGHRKKKIDIALKRLRTSKLIYCLEVKTNFEDNFDEYFKAQQLIFHHRTKVYKNFKYHYVSMTNRPPKYIKDKKLSKKVMLLEKRNQLWEFPVMDPSQIDEKLVDKGAAFLDAIYKPI